MSFDVPHHGPPMPPAALRPPNFLAVHVLPWQKVAHIAVEPSDRSAASTPCSTLSSSSATLVEDEVFYPAGFGPNKDTLSRPPSAQRRSPPFTTWAHHRAEDARVAFLRKRGLPIPPPPPTACASTFVPAVVRARVSSVPKPSPLQEKPAWLTPLRQGSVTKDRTVRRSYAKTVVALGPWDAQAMAVLAGKISDRAAEGHGPILAPVALFARALCDEFEAACGEAYAVLFQAQLTHCVWLEFSACWDPESPTAIGHLAHCWPAQTQPLLSSALAVATFAADLFARGLATTPFMLHCLHTLVRRMRVIEEAHAVLVMLKHADARLAADGAITHFADAFECSARGIADGASVVGQQFDREEVQRWIADTRYTAYCWTHGIPAPEPSTPAMSDSNSDSVLGEPVVDADATPRVPPPAAGPVRRSYSDALKKQT